MGDIEKAMSAPDFWDHGDRAQEMVAELSALKAQVGPLDEMTQSAQDLSELLEMIESPDDTETLSEIDSELKAMEASLGRFETAALLSGPDDDANVIFSIQPGAGGIDSANWAGMLLRMYENFFDKQGWKIETLDFQPNEEAGKPAISGVTLRVSGDKVFGFLKSERGVHRLIRISPFDKSARRHTAFAAVDAIPEVEETEIEIREEDLRIDRYRAGGAGGLGG